MYNYKKYGNYRYSKYSNSNKRYNKYGNKLSKGEKKEVKRIIKKEMAPEIKYHTKQILTATNYAVPSGTGFSFSDLTDCTQGITDSQRVGDDVKIKALVLKYSLSAGADYIQGSVRIIVFQWHVDSIQQVPTAPLLFMNGPSGSIDALSHWNEDSKTSNTFTVLYDKLIPTMSAALGNGGGDQITKDLKIYLKWAKKNIHYTSGQDYGRDHIYFTAISDKAPSGSNAVFLTMNSRMYFTDS